MRANVVVTWKTLSYVTFTLHWCLYFVLAGGAVYSVVTAVFVFLHKVVLMRGCSTSAPLETSPTLWPSWQVTTFPKTSVMTTDTQTLQTPVPWERPVKTLSTKSEKMLLPILSDLWIQSNNPNQHIFSVCLPHHIHSSWRLFGKRSRHGRVQPRVSETPAPIWPRARLPSPGKVGEYKAGLELIIIFFFYHRSIKWGKKVPYKFPVVLYCPNNSPHIFGLQ